MSGSDALRAGEIAEGAGDFVGATAAYQSALTDDDLTVVGNAQFRLGRVAWRQGQLDIAQERFEAARAISLRTGDDQARALVENALGLVHYSRGEYVQARAAFDVAHELSDDATLRAKVLLNLGILANIAGDFEQAKASYMRSRLSFQVAGDRAGEALAVHNLGMVYADLHQWDEADEAFRECLQLCEEQGNRPLTASVLVNWSEVHCARGRFDDAIADCDRAISISKELGAEVQYGEALRWKGQALSASGRHAIGETALRDAVRIARRTHVKLLEAEAAGALGSSVASRGDEAGARKWLTRALDLYESMGLKREAADISARLEPSKDQ